jgi:hypothetical protein
MISVLNKRKFLTMTASKALVTKRVTRCFLLLFSLFFSLSSMAIGPVITAISGPSSGSYTNNDILEFVVSFSQNVTYTPPAGSGRAYLMLSLDSGKAYAQYKHSNNNKVIFSYTPSLNDFDFNGIDLAGFYQFEVKNSFGESSLLSLNNIANLSGMSGIVIEHSNVAELPTANISSTNILSTNNKQSFSLRWGRISTLAITGGTPQLAIRINDSPYMLDGVASTQGKINFSYTANNNTDDVQVESFRLNNAIITGSTDSSEDSSNGKHLLSVTNTNFVNSAQTSQVRLVSDNSSVILLDEMLMPHVIAVDVPIAADYTRGDTVDFTVHFDQAVQAVDTATTHLRIKLDNERTVLANYILPSDNSAEDSSNDFAEDNTQWNFSYTLTSDDLDVDGIELVALESASGYIDGTNTYLFSDWQALALTNVGDLTGVTFNLTHILQVSSIALPEKASYVAGETVNFTLNFTKNITLTGSPLLYLTVGNRQVIAQYVSGSGTSALVFSYLLIDDLADAKNISVTSLLLNGATLVADNKPNTAIIAVKLPAQNTDVLTPSQPNTVIVAEDSSTKLTLLADFLADSLSDNTGIDNNNNNNNNNTDALVIAIITPPTHGELVINDDDTVTYTPLSNYVGNDSFIYRIDNNEGNVSNPIEATIRVTPVNDEPIANTDTIAVTEGQSVFINALMNDTDIDNDKLTLVSATADRGTVTIENNQLNYQAIANYIGSTTISYTLSDNMGGTAQASVNISLLVDPQLQEPPVVVTPAPLNIKATALYTRVDLGIATATDRFGNALPVLLADKPFFKAGINFALWQAEDTSGLTASATQQINIHPLISLSSNQTVVEGGQVTVTALLNGDSPVYPLTIPYTVSGSASQGLDHDLSAGSIVIESGRQGEIHFTVLTDEDNTESNEEIIITLNADINTSLNLGSKTSHKVLITAQNVAPTLTLTVLQNTIQTLTATRADGLVTVNLSVSDANVEDSHSIDWSTSDSVLVNLSTDEPRFSFDPASLADGLYRVRAQVIDSHGLTDIGLATIKVIAAWPTLTTTDSDGDGIADNKEGYRDQDGDGIPDYQDTIAADNVIPAKGDNQQQFLVEADSGVRLQLGSKALLSDNAGIQIEVDDLIADNNAENIGGIFDFIANGLPEPGQSYNIVLPQYSAIPDGAVLRKYIEGELSEARWINFIEIANTDVIRSAKGERGFCPPPGNSSTWTAGLTEGDWCIQITLRDGGPNDDDGVENGVIIDPLGMAVIISNNHAPEAIDDTVDITKNSNHVIITVLDNDLDADMDTLSLASVNADLGVTEIHNGSILYTPPTDYIGSDHIIYSISDGNGGSATATVTVLIADNNQLPLALDDNASTNDITDIIIDVLANDTDADGDTLVIDSASTSQGSVQVIDNQLHYQPELGHIGSVRIEYIISDGQGGLSGGVVRLDIIESEQASEAKNSSGGTMAGIVLMLLLLIGIRIAARANRINVKI